MPSSIVTGAASGNGRAIAEELTNRGHRVIAVDLTPIAEDTGTIRIVGDVTDDEVMVRTFEQALIDTEGDLHLVNNAGVTIDGFPQPEEAWRHTMEINLDAPFRWTRQFGIHVARGQVNSGSVVFIGSLGSAQGFPRNPAYQASKSGVLGLTRAFAYDFGAYGIRVNCVTPGYIHTGMTDQSYNDPARHEARRRHTLLGRWGAPSDVAQAVAFLCDPASAYITGINLPVDGGWLAKGLIEEL